MQMQKTTICLIDDEPEILSSLSETLSNGYQINIFSGANEALEAFGSGFRSDIIVTDLKMPSMSGLDFMREATMRNIATPFVMMSGNAKKADVISAIGHGVSAFLEKPFTMDHFKTTVDLVVEERATADAELLQSVILFTHASRELRNLFYDRLAQAENILAALPQALAKSKGDIAKYLEMIRTERTLMKEISEFERLFNERMQ